MIRYDGFTKRFGRVLAVHDLNLEIARGETTALIGPNGSGKTTTLKAAVGLVRPSSGSVLVAGIAVTGTGPTARDRVGYLPQRPSFATQFTAREQLTHFARLRGVPAARVDELLEFAGLADAADRQPDGFSGGMAQRLGLAVALIAEPDVLVLDEPTAALDPSGSLAVRDLILEIERAGTTVLLSSHDLTEVAALATRIAVFDAGRLAVYGTSTELVRDLGLASRLRVELAAVDHHAATAARQAGAKRADWDGTVFRCHAEPGQEAGIVEALRGAGTSITEVTVDTPDVEEIYRAVVTPHPKLVA